MIQLCVRISLCLLALAVAPGFAQEKGTAPAETAMTPEQQQAMEAFMKAMTPGDAHRHLASQAGDWDFVGKFWMEPGAPPQESKGHSSREMILGGRVLRESITSEMMGMPFQGLGMTGFDNVTGRFWSTWNDNMSTGVMTSEGTCDAAMTRCEYRGSYSDPISGEKKATRMVIEGAADREIFTGFETGPDGKEIQTMEMVYARKKK